jgi:hypothetical protein
MTMRAIDSKRFHETPGYLAELAQSYANENGMHVWIVIQHEEWFFSPFAPGSREVHLSKLSYVAEVSPDPAAAGLKAATVGG